MQRTIWNKIKHRIRQKIKRKHPLVLAFWKAFVAIVAILAVVICSSDIVLANEEVMTMQNDVSLIDPNKYELSTWFENDQKIKVIHHKVYVCGEEIEELNMLSYEDVIVIAQQNPTWNIMVDEVFSIIRFEETINDLSPYCKMNAFFGMDTIGQFSLYDGTPEHDKVIRTFFQLNIPFLESRLPQGEYEHLSLGIKVRTIEEYDSVLSTYSEYRVDRYLHNY